jgi:histidinol-phosphatase
MASESLRDLLDFASEIAWQAGKITLEYFQSGVVPDLKADDSPVTIADRRSEEYLRAAIAARYPSHGILGEEYGETNPGATYRWILDPIDGTKTFVRGVPLYGVLVGLERAGQPVLGVANMPALNELVAAAEGLGCYSNGRRARVSPVERLDEALLVATDMAGLAAHAPQVYHELVAATKLQRTWADCYGYVLVATGRAEVALDPQMHVWDCAPLLTILQEAGGTFTDWAGNATIHGGNAFATNGRLFTQVLEVLAKS